MRALAKQLSDSLQAFQASGNPSVAQSAASYLSMLSQATTGLSKVEESFAKVMSMRQYLEGDRAAIESRLPRGDLNQLSKSALQRVQEGVDKVNSILADRDEKIKELGIMVEDVNGVREELTRYGPNGNMNSIYISGFAPVAEKLRALEGSEETQTFHLTDLKDRIRNFSNMRDQDEVIKERQMIFEQLSEVTL